MSEQRQRVKCWITVASHPYFSICEFQSQFRIFRGEIFIVTISLLFYYDVCFSIFLEEKKDKN